MKIHDLIRIKNILLKGEIEQINDDVFIVKMNGETALLVEEKGQTNNRIIFRLSLLKN